MATIAANGAAIPVIGLGTGRLRGDVAVRAVHAALDCGYRHIDTAAKYGNEAEVGAAIRSHALLRDDIFVNRFHADPRVSATELLLQERVPREAILAEARPVESTTAVALPTMSTCGEARPMRTL